MEQPHGDWVVGYTTHTGYVPDACSASLCSPPRTQVSSSAICRQKARSCCPAGQALWVPSGCATSLYTLTAGGELRLPRPPEASRWAQHNTGHPCAVNTSCRPLRQQQACRLSLNTSVTATTAVRCCAGCSTERTCQGQPEADECLGSSCVMDLQAAGAHCRCNSLASSDVRHRTPRRSRHLRVPDIHMTIHSA